VARSVTLRGILVGCGASRVWVRYRGRGATPVGIPHRVGLGMIAPAKKHVDELLKLLPDERS